MSKEWFYQLMGSEVGPLNSAELRHKVMRGEISPDTPVRIGGSSRWVDASQIKGLFDIPAPPTPVPAAKIVKPASPSSASIKTTAAEEPSSSPKGDSAKPTQDDLLDAHAPNEDYEFFKFVGFRQALSEKLYDHVDAFRMKNGWTMTQITRRALAEFVGKPELAEDKPLEAADIRETDAAASDKVAGVPQTADANSAPVAAS